MIVANSWGISGGTVRKSKGRSKGNMPWIPKGLFPDRIGKMIAFACLKTKR